MEQRTFNVHDPDPLVPNFRGGPSENTKWFVMLLIAILGFAAGPVVTLIRAPRQDEFTAFQNTQRDAIMELKLSVQALKSAADAHIQVENERSNTRALEYSNLKEAIDNVKKSKR